MTNNLPAGVTPELYPFTGKFLTLKNGLRLHYLDEGAGKPVLMLHGNPSWSFYYRNLAQALRGANRVIVPDHIGCGLSDKPGDDRYDYTLQSRIEDVEALLGSLELKFHLKHKKTAYANRINTFAKNRKGKIKKVIM